MSTYDQFIPAIKSGIGLGAYHYMSSFGEHSFNSRAFFLSVAPKFSLKGKYTFSPSLEFNVRGNSYNSFSGFGTRAGFLFNSPKKVKSPYFLLLRR